MRRERVAAHRVIGKWAKQVPVIDRLETIPGVGPITARTPVGPARASKRGNRALKRVLFLAAQAATRGKNALARRYTARREAGWRHGKAPRDLARTLLMIAWCLWKKGVQYDDRRIAALSAD